MKTKTTKNMEKERLIGGLLFWCGMLLAIILEYNSIDLTFNNPLMCIFWLMSVLMIISWIFCINLPVGARKYTKRWFIQSNSAVDDSELRKEIRWQSRQAIKIAVIWIIFLSIEGIALYFNIVTEKFIIFGMCILRIVDKLFIFWWCPFGAIMNNKCCTSCRIYGWDQLMLNSPMIFLPSLFSYSLVILSMIPFIQWEVAIRRHPERFSPRSNVAIRCSNCPGVCGRCKKVD